MVVEVYAFPQQQYLRVFTQHPLSRLLTNLSTLDAMNLKLSINLSCCFMSFPSLSVFTKTSLLKLIYFSSLFWDAVNVSFTHSKVLLNR